MGGSVGKIVKRIPFVRKIIKKGTGFLKKINKKAYGIPGEIWKELRKNKPIMAAAGPYGAAGAEGVQLGEEFENVAKGKDGQSGQNGVSHFPMLEDGASGMPHSMSSQKKQIPYQVANMTRYGPYRGGKVHPLGEKKYATGGIDMRKYPFIPFADKHGKRGIPDMLRKHLTPLQNVGAGFAKRNKTNFFY